MTTKEIQDAVDEIMNDPELAEDIISGYEKKYPNITADEIIADLYERLAHEYSEVADDETRLHQRKSSLNTIANKSLNCSSDSGESRITKINIKQAAKVAMDSSSTGFDTSVVADYFSQFASDFTAKRTKKSKSINEIDEELSG
jgi:alkylhydroperoxidase/carboxymuconolactone decarboxylase family protein YurZ